MKRFILLAPNGFARLVCAKRALPTLQSPQAAIGMATKSAGRVGRVATGGAQGQEIRGAGNYADSEQRFAASPRGRAIGGKGWWVG